MGNLCRARVKLLVINEQQNQKKDQYSGASECVLKEENGRKSLQNASEKLANTQIRNFR
jgi:hypothetical protein